MSNTIVRFEGFGAPVGEFWRAAAPVTGWLGQHVGASALSANRGRRRH